MGISDQTRSNTVPLILIVGVVHEVFIVIFVVEVEHVVPHYSLLPVPVIVSQWLRNIPLVNPGLKGIEVLLRIGNVIEVDDLAVRLGVPDLDADSTSRSLRKMGVTLWASQ